MPSHEEKAMKCATVSVIGRPSAGKSTLINTICEMKVSITAPTPQTTRNAIRGIYTDQRGQLIFTDTPGYHLGGKTINRRMQEITAGALSESDIILYIVDATRPMGEEEEAITALLSAVKAPIVTVLNKSDVVSEDQRKDAEFFLTHHVKSSVILTASGLNDEGVDESLIELFSLAKEGDLLYGEEASTDQPLEFRISEIIREKTINLLTDELPHVIYVEVADIEYNEAEQSVWVRAFIITERDGQKGIIVGKGGENIKKIRKEAFKEIKRIFPGSSLTLDLRVKANPKWRNNQVVLDKIFRTL